MNITISQLEKACIDSCMDCLESSTRCAIICKKLPGMEACVENCENCLQACRACIEGIKNGVANLHELLKACIAACKACADECEMHPHDHCVACAQNCRECVEVCEDLVESMEIRN